MSFFIIKNYYDINFLTRYFHTKTLKTQKMVFYNSLVSVHKFLVIYSAQLLVVVKEVLFLENCCTR